MKLRKITPADDAAIAALIRHSLEKYGLDIPGTAYFDEHLDHLSEFYGQDPEHRAYYILQADNGSVAGGVGVAEFDAIENCAELQKLYLADNLQGQGLGYGLIKIAETAARRLGYKKLYLETHTNLQAAMHIYEKTGFKKIQRPEAAVHSTMDSFYLKDL